MTIIETALTNGEQLTFSALFIALLLYVIKTNDKREEDYRSTIEKLASALNGFEDLKASIEDIKRKIGG